MLKNIFSTWLVLSAFAVMPQDTKGKTLNLYSNELGGNRSVFIHFPIDYEENLEYDTLYIFDGKESGFNVRDYLINKGEHDLAKQYIVVSIENKDRGHDFSPPYEVFGRDKKVQGNAHKFLSFLEKELIPEVDSNYKTSNNRLIVGHSWSAAFTSYVLSVKPMLFTNYIIISPTIIYRSTVEESTKQIIEDFNKNILFKKQSPESIYITVGATEPPKYSAPFYKLTEYFDTNLPKQIRYKNMVLEGTGHFESLEKSLVKGIKFTLARP